MDLRDEELQMEEEGGAKVPRARRRCLIYSSLEIHRTLGAKKGGKSRSCAGIIIGDVDRERRVAVEEGRERAHAEWEWRGCVRHTSLHDLL